MHQLPDSIAAGAARFDDAELARAEQSQGGVAAWQQALRRPQPPVAAAQGHFAAAVAEGGRVLLAVDRFATEPLCYRHTGHALTFAQRADALAGEAPELDPQALFDYLYFHAIPAPRTIFKGVQRLPAGQRALAQGGELDVAPYWTATFDEQPVASFDDAKARFRRLLADAVSRRLDGSRPACFLSGGTDSSTVAGMICQVSGQPAATYSIGFDAEGYDEMAYARLAARHFGCEHHEYYVTPDDLVQGIPAMAAHFDQPFGNSSVLPSYYCALKARGDGVTRMLAGDGGDELFGGNSRYAKQRVFGAYEHVPALLRRAVLEPLFGMRAMAGLPLLKKGASYIEQARVALPARQQMYNLLLRLGPQQVLTAQALALMDAAAPARLQQAVWDGARTTSALNRTLAFDWRFTLADSDLPKVRHATSLAGVEVAYPLLDTALLDFSMQLPSSFKLRGLKLRWFFKEALRGFLPDEIITKKKQGFGLPFGVWANRHQGLNQLASDSVRGLAGRGLVRADFVQTLLDTHLPAYPGYYGEMVWILMMLEQWLRSHAPDWRLTG
jgi:asparagine synthase (glutamine-hydrolysing)